LKFRKDSGVSHPRFGNVKKAAMRLTFNANLTA
jgi:hypothetical protein